MGLNYKEIIERMRWAGKLKNDSAVARALGVTPQAFSNYKKREEIPSGLVLKFANLYGLSMDWLITGTGPMNKAGRVAPPPVGKVDGVQKIKALSPEEMVYIGKLLKILRGKDGRSMVAIKHTVDSLSQLSTPLDEIIDKQKAG